MLQQNFDVIFCFRFVLPSVSIIHAIALLDIGFLGLQPWGEGVQGPNKITLRLMLMTTELCTVMELDSRCEKSS